MVWIVGDQRRIKALSRDTLSLKLNGDVPLALFANVLGDFADLVKALTEEALGPDERVEWTIAHLESGSALTEIRGVTQDPIYIEKVVQAYAVLGTALADRKPPPFSEEVIRPALKITQAINGHISSVAFVTDTSTSLINEKIEEQSAGKIYSIGTITGIVRAISDKPKLRLAVYDTLFNKVVYCYLDADQQEKARQAWRNRVAVTGLIYRDPISGRPIEMSAVRAVEILETVAPRTYRDARGVIPLHEGDEPAEVSVRRMRDAI